MDGTKKQISFGIGAGVLAIVCVALIVLFVVVYTGAYNVAASEDHTPFMRWAITTSMKNSVKNRAKDLQVPETFDSAMISAGAAEYKSMCQHCHGGPGVDRDEWAEGMLPQPPHLTEVASEWDINEVFWLVKHGIKMAGMPAFGENHNDETIWAIAGFVKRLPAMTEAEYAAYETKEDDSHSHQASAKAGSEH